MDQAVAIAEAIAIATLISTLFQERFLSHLQGTKAYVASVLLALACGSVGVFRAGGFDIVAQAGDPFTFGALALGLAVSILVASKAAFEKLVKPLAKTPA